MKRLAVKQVATGDNRLNGTWVWHLTLTSALAWQLGQVVHPHEENNIHYKSHQRAWYASCRSQHSPSCNCKRSRRHSDSGLAHWNLAICAGQVIGLSSELTVNASSFTLAKEKFDHGTKGVNEMQVHTVVGNTRIIDTGSREVINHPGLGGLNQGKSPGNSGPCFQVRKLERAFSPRGAFSGVLNRLACNTKIVFSPQRGGFSWALCLYDYFTDSICLRDGRST